MKTDVTNRHIMRTSELNRVIYLYGNWSFFVKIPKSRIRKVLGAREHNCYSAGLLADLAPGPAGMQPTYYGTRPDRQLARKWKTERALKQCPKGIYQRKETKNARKRNKLISISKDHINDSQEQTSTNDDESAIEDIEQMLILPIMRQQLENVQVTKWANQADSNETIEIKYDDLEELEQQITLSSLNEWEVGTVNVSRKFKAHQRQLVTSVRQKKTKLTWNNTFELLQSPIINNCNVLVLSLFYITSSEWRQVINSNPYKTTLPILTDSLL
ncbi:11545_t:CDS:2 [Funneliformis geosporum]|nr:11545_t:CDS:2 [Funneliformis geosporum]